MGRSGTTLLDKILCNHSDISILSQPFPYFFLNTKKHFFLKIGYPPTYYPHNHYFLEDKYSLSDLNHFLENFQLTQKQILSIFEEMKGYKGQFTKFPDLDSKLSNFGREYFIAIYKNLVYSLRHKDKSIYFGSKETQCEEFFPFFLSNSVKCLSIVRDPRDVITSFNYGKGRDYGGKIRPTLFYIRNWRKSIAFTLYLRNNPDFMWIKYEDMIRSPERNLLKITNFLKLNPFPDGAVKKPIFDQQGEPWKGNSSHGPLPNISSDSIGKFRHFLPENLIKYVEITCEPEMKYLDYQLQYPEILDFSEESKILFLHKFKEPFPVVRKEFEKEYSSLKKNLSDEIERLHFIRHPELSTDNNKMTQYFIFTDIFKLLTQTIRDETKKS